MYTHSKHILEAGLPVAEAKNALILIHGRGGSANDMIGLASSFQLADAAIFAPQASNNSWYPYSFMAPDHANEQALKSAMDLLADLLAEVVASGIPKERIYFAGFSQGACLTLEFIAKNPARYGGVIAFTGGLIGHKFQPEKYSGDLQGTPIALSTSDPDPHVPIQRVQESADLLRNMKANVRLTAYPGKPHTIVAEEIAVANEHVFSH